MMCTPNVAGVIACDSACIDDSFPMHMLHDDNNLAAISGPYCLLVYASDCQCTRLNGILHIAQRHESGMIIAG